MSRKRRKGREEFRRGDLIKSIETSSFKFAVLFKILSVTTYSYVSSWKVEWHSAWSVAWAGLSWCLHRILICLWEWSYLPFIPLSSQYWTEAFQEMSLFGKHLGCLPLNSEGHELLCMVLLIPLTDNNHHEHLWKKINSLIYKHEYYLKSLYLNSSFSHCKQLCPT